MILPSMSEDFEFYKMLLEQILLVKGIPYDIFYIDIIMEETNLYVPF